MEYWHSIEQISEAFGLGRLENGNEGVRDELKRIVASLHPDKTGGEFGSDDGKRKFLRAKSALEFLDGQPRLSYGGFLTRPLQ